MREYSKISPKFWVGKTGRAIKELGHHTRMVALYFITCPHANMLGIYYLPLAYITHDLMMTELEVNDAIKNLSYLDFCTYDSVAEYIWVHEMGKHQISEQLDERDNRIKGVNNIFHTLPELSFLEEFYQKYKRTFLLRPRKTRSIKTDETNADSTNAFDKVRGFEGALKPLRSQEQGQEQDIYMSGKPDLYSLENLHFKKRKSKSECDAKLKNEAIHILQFLNDKTNRNYRPVDSNLYLIMSCLESGVSVDQCRQVIAKKSREWRDKKMKEYLRPATLFNPIKFEQYLGELIKLKTREGVENDE